MTGSRVPVDAFHVSGGGFRTRFRPNPPASRTARAMRGKLRRTGSILTGSGLRGSAPRRPSTSQVGPRGNVLGSRPERTRRTPSSSSDERSETGPQCTQCGSGSTGDGRLPGDLWHSSSSRWTHAWSTSTRTPRSSNVRWSDARAVHDLITSAVRAGLEGWAPSTRGDGPAAARARSTGGAQGR